MARPSKYTPEFRRRAVEEVLDRDRTVTEVARALSITTPETLRRWVIQASNARTASLRPVVKRAGYSHAELGQIGGLWCDQNFSDLLFDRLWMRNTCMIV